MQELRPIRVFLEVAAQRSFARAARTLRMTPASVTRIVARLEADLQQQLLVRTTRQVSLTTAGALVATRYGPLVEEFDRITLEFERATRADQGSLFISVPMSFGLRLLPQLVDRFRTAYPQIQLHVNLNDTLVDVVADGWDLAIRISEPPTDRSTIWRKVCEVPRFAVGTPSLFERVSRPSTPEDLDQRLCLSYASGKSREIWHLTKGATKRSIAAGDEIVSNNGDFLYALVLSGAGIAVLPEFIVSEGLADGRVERVLPEWTPAPLWLALYYPPYDVLPPLVATFTDFFEAFLRGVDALDFRDS